MTVPPSEKQRATPTAAAGNRWPVYWMLAADLISSLGNRITLLAIPWFVLQTTGSAGMVGLVGAATLAPMVVSTFIGGTLTDRMSHRQLAIMSDVLSGVTVAAVPTFYYTTGITISTLMVLVFLGALFDAPGANARMAMIPKLVSDSGLSLERVNSGLSVARSLVGLIGAPIAGFLIAVVGATPALWIDAATFAVSALVVRILLPATSRPESSGTSIVRDMKDGLRFLFGSRLLRSLTVTAIVVNMVLGLLFVVGLPVYVRNAGHDVSMLGLLMAGLATGALVGSTLYGWIGDRLPGRVMIFVSVVMITLSMILIALQPPLMVMWLLLVVLNVGSGISGPLLMTFFHRHTPERLLGRALGTFSSAAMVSSPIGVLAGGAMIETQGFGFTALMGAIAMALVLGWLLFSSAIADLGGPAAAATSE